MTEPIDINTTHLLPPRTRGPLTQEQYDHEKPTGRVFRLHHQFPKPYVEYYIEAEPETPLDDGRV